MVSANMLEGHSSKNHHRPREKGAECEKNYYCNTKSREARLGGALVSYEGLTNSIRAYQQI